MHTHARSEEQVTHAAVKIPYALGIIATRSLDEQVIGISDLEKKHEKRIRNGMIAYEYLEKLRAGDDTPANIEKFDNVKDDLGYGLLLKRYTPNVVDASEAQIQQAVKDSFPKVGPMFWSFRIMVGCGVIMLGVFILSFYYNAHRIIEQKRWLLWAAVLSIPLPWIAIEFGWIVAEYGRQPWAISEVLPTFLATSSLTVNDILISLTGFIVFYTGLAIVEAWLMIKFIKQGPSSLHTGKYHFELPDHSTAAKGELS